MHTHTRGSVHSPLQEAAQIFEGVLNGVRQRRGEGNGIWVDGTVRLHTWVERVDGRPQLAGRM